MKKDVREEESEDARGSVEERTIILLIEWEVICDTIDDDSGSAIRNEPDEKRTPHRSVKLMVNEG